VLDVEDVEITVLRHQLIVVRRQVARSRYTSQDRLVLAMLGRLPPRERWRLSDHSGGAAAVAPRAGRPSLYTGPMEHLPVTSSRSRRSG
jgi:hypothetical protein